MNFELQAKKQYEVPSIVEPGVGHSSGLKN